MTVRKTWLNNCGDISSLFLSCPFFFSSGSIHSLSIYIHIYVGAETQIWINGQAFFCIFHSFVARMVPFGWMYGGEKKKMKLNGDRRPFALWLFFRDYYFVSNLNKMRLMLCWWRQWRAPVLCIFHHHLWLSEKKLTMGQKSNKPNSTHTKRGQPHERVINFQLIYDIKNWFRKKNSHLI